VLTNFVVTLLLLLLPMVVVLAWRHGTPGEDRWTRFDGAAIGLGRLHLHQLLRESVA
jgi:hypothetical protein